MNRSAPIHRPAFLLLGGLGWFATAFGQSEPAARMHPAQAIDTPVVRSATPDPTPTYGRIPTNPEPAPKTLLGDGSTSKNWFSSKTEKKPDEDKKPWWPTTEPAKKPQQPIVAIPPGPGTPPPGAYVGPPAYRWYGYGAPTPGANPFAPSGVYPKPSTNWLQQSGATVGAFPVPTPGAVRTAVFEPAQPSLASQQPQPESTFFPSSNRTAEPPLPSNRILASTAPRPTPVAVDPPVIASNAPTLPSLPTGPSTVVKSSGPIALERQPEVTWQTIDGKALPTIASTPIKADLPVPVAPNATETPWAPATTAPQSNPSPPSVTMIRGQAPAAKKVDLEELIRTACFGRTTSVTVLKSNEKGLLVKLVAPTESDAREAVGLVSRLPELKEYSVKFEAVLR